MKWLRLKTYNRITKKQGQSLRNEHCEAELGAGGKWKKAKSQGLSLKKGGMGKIGEEKCADSIDRRRGIR